jgi:hypothetical protein
LIYARPLTLSVGTTLSTSFNAGASLTASENGFSRFSSPPPHGFFSMGWPAPLFIMAVG